MSNKRDYRAGTAKKTPRGFNVYAEFEDSYGVGVKVQQSSAMSEDEHGASYVWVFVHEEAHVRMHLGEKTYPALHLNPEQAKQLRDALDAHLAALEAEKETTS